RVRVVIPIALTLLIIGVATGYYFHSVTGSSVRMPYQVNRNTYAKARYFYWQQPNLQPVYRNQAMQDFYEGLELSEYRHARSLDGFSRQTAIKAANIWLFYIGPALSIPLLMLPWVLRDRRTRFLVIAGNISLTATVMVIFFLNHYVAPLAGIIVAVLVQCM